MGETGVWQLVDPPILPLTHGPNHSFNWREMLMQDWRICCLALLSFGSPELLNKYLFLTHTAINPAQLPKKQQQKTKKTRLASVKDTLQKKKCIHWSKCIQTHCSGMRKYSLCGDHSKNELQIGRQFVAFPSTFHFLAQNVEVLWEIWIFLDGCWWIRFYATRRCH